MGIFPGEGFEVAFDFPEIVFHVSGGDDLSGAFNPFTLIIQSVEQNGNLGLLSNKIEALFPVGIERTGSLGCHAEMKLGGFAGLVGQEVGHARLSAAPYGNAAEASEDWA